MMKIANKVAPGDKVVVADGVPHHSGRVGYFHFAGIGASAGVVVLREQQDEHSNPLTLFAVDARFVSKVY
jgi:hypothetical protein